MAALASCWAIDHINPLARIQPRGTLCIQPYTVSTRLRSLIYCMLNYKHAVKMQQTAVDRGRSQNDNSLKIARGPQKKK